ncbi:MAG: hypothetical protein L0216_08660 [Planctomycetales bacterium]|nr:hypothetical protein [Planctomycetales bacterium]
MYDKVAATDAPGPGPVSPAEAAATVAAIRRFMERATEFSGHSALAGVVAGVATLLGAGALLARHGPAVPPPGEFGMVWGSVAGVAILSAVLFTVRKARLRRDAVWNAPTRMVVAALAPPFLAAVALTAALGARGPDGIGLLPGVWLLLYGAGLWGASLQTRREFQAIGAAAMALGAAALASPAPLGTLFMGAGFGGLHVLYAAVAARMDRPSARG